MIARAPWAPAALLAAVLLAVTGCSSSGKAAKGSTGAGASTSASAPTTSTAPTSTAPAAAPGTGAPADAATTKAVAAAYTTFFDPKAPIAKTQAALQHGASFTATLNAAAKSKAAQGIAAKATAVNLVNANLAYVTFSLTNLGSPLLTDSPGYAVRENGVWKVAAQTFCNLLTLQGTVVPACKQPAITALPS